MEMFVMFDRVEVTDVKSDASSEVMITAV